MKGINISHHRSFPCTIKGRSSEMNESLSAQNLLQPEGFWATQPREASIYEYVILDYSGPVVIDYVEVKAHRKETFPSSFRLEASNDGENWRVLVSEKNAELDGKVYRVDFELTELHFLKLVGIANRRTDRGFQVEIDSITAGISGIADMEVSSSDEESDPRNILVDSNRDQWKSEPKTQSSREWVVMDLGDVYSINRIVLESANSGFPENFTIETSEEEDIWTTIHYENDFHPEPFHQYYWETGLVKARYIRIEGDAARFFENRYQMVLAGIKVYGAPRSVLHSHNIGELTMHASVFQSGMVRLARDGEDTMGSAVQGNDRRLRDATELFKGIVRFAAENETDPFTAVQASDPRLKPARDDAPGIVRFAYDRETKPGTAVQGNDTRLKHATTENFGIVKLCPNGEAHEQGVVTGDDFRLQKATSYNFGICRIAENGESSPNAVVSSSDTRLQPADVATEGIVRLALDGEDTEGRVVQANDQRLREATILSKGIVELADDREDSPGTVVQGNDSRLRDATTENKGIVELADDGEVSPGAVVQGNDSRLRDATTDSKGIVELADDGETNQGTVVQGNDRRLRDATVVSKGIVRLASDGEEEEGAAVQGNDRRLRGASTVAPGIVRLANDGEADPGTAVQGNDYRLRDATTESKGIVELAENGEVKPGAAVQSDDHRLRDATTESKGIVELAENGEKAQGRAVQGNDRRLRDATTENKGIVELAEDGEVSPGTVVQGNDSRLKKATTHSTGIVELAEDGENEPGVAVQGNDSRLRQGTTEYAGIVRFAENGEKRNGKAVQGHDKRLSDAREPLPHDHDYASRVHAHNDHAGTIEIQEDRSQPFQDITAPPSHGSVIYGKNTSSKKGSVGIAGVTSSQADVDVSSYGVVGHSSHTGVRGQNSGSEANPGSGVMGISRFGSGGLFASEQGYAVVADGTGAQVSRHDPSVSLKGSGQALLVQGESRFDGSMYMSGSREGEDPQTLVDMFELDENEYISPGDLVAVSPNGNSVLTRSRTPYNRSVVGVVAGNPTFIMNNSGKDEKVYPVALTGKVWCKIDARNRPVKPGDLIVSSETPGCGMAGTIDSLDKIGTVIGKALHSLDEGIGVIPVFITHQ